MASRTDLFPIEEKQVILAVVFGVLGGLAVVSCLFIWGRRRVRRTRHSTGTNAASDIELGQSSSGPQRHEGTSTRRYDNSHLDPTLPAYENTGADEVPSLFSLSSSIASLKASERDLTTSPFHLIFFERMSKLQTMIKEIQLLLEAAPPEGYVAQSEDGKAVEALKTEMLGLVGTPEAMRGTQTLPKRGSLQQDDMPSMSTVVSAHEPDSSLRDEAFRHQQLIQIHSLIALLTPILSKYTPQHDSTFEGLGASVNNLLRSLDAVPIPPVNPSNTREHETANHGERNSTSETDPTVQTPSFSGQESHLPPYQ